LKSHKDQEACWKYRLFEDYQFSHRSSKIYLRH
jgi:hypothetical protein